MILSIHTMLLEVFLPLHVHWLVQHWLLCDRIRGQSRAEPQIHQQRPVVDCSVHRLCMIHFDLYKDDGGPISSDVLGLDERDMQNSSRDSQVCRLRPRLVADRILG